MSNCVTLKIDGFDLQEMVEMYAKQKLGVDIDLNYSELITEKIRNQHILNDDSNEFTLFLYSIYLEKSNWFI